MIKKINSHFKRLLAHIIAFGRNNEYERLAWLKEKLQALPAGCRLLDAGAGELRNKAYYSHLTNVSQDFCQYEGQGDGVALQPGKWDITRIDLVSDITAPFCSLTHFAPYYYASGLSKYWFEKHLSELGFTSVEATPNGGWLDFVAQEVWRLPWIGRTYSSLALGWLALLLALPVLGMMRLMKAGDRGSSELLTFGWQVVACKP